MALFVEHRPEGLPTLQYDDKVFCPETAVALFFMCLLL